ENANHIFTLTPDAQGKAGAATFNNKIDLTHDFNMAFDIYFGPQHAADGMAFILHNDLNGLNAIGGEGGNLGAIGLQNGLAIEFDTWQNVNLGDPNYYHTRILDTDNGVNLTPASDLGNIVDGGWHQVGVTWDSQAHTLRYWVDGTLGGTLTGDIATRYLGGQTTAYVGFIGAPAALATSSRSVTETSQMATGTACWQLERHGSYPDVLVRRQRTILVLTAVSSMKTRRRALL